MPWLEGSANFDPFDHVFDTVSGWKGKITAKYVYSNGCVRYEVSGADKDGKPEGFVFDEQQLKLVADAARAGSIPPPVPTGGSQSNRPVPR